MSHETTKPTKKVNGGDRVPEEPHFELRKDEATGEWNWVFWSTNHRPIAANINSYSRRNDAQRAISHFRQETGCAKIFIGK